MRAVLIRLSSLGDVVLTEPLVRSLKTAGYSVCFVTRPGLTALVSKYFATDEVVGWAKGQSVAAVAPGIGMSDVVVDLQGSLRARALGRALKTKRRLTFRKRSLAQGLLSLAGRGPVFHDRSSVDMYLEVISPLGCQKPNPRHPVFDQTSSSTHRIGLAVGAAHRTKQWPASHFAELWRRLKLNDPTLQPVLLCGTGDHVALTELFEAAPELREAPNCTHMDIEDLATQTAGCDVVIANDSGPAHLAAALGVPVVAIFGPTSWLRWGPRAPNSQIVRRELECSPCSNIGGPECPLGHHACLQELDVDLVEQAVHKALGSAR